MEKDCIFCKIASGEMGTEFLYESDEIVAFRDIHPRAPIHFLVIPKKHIPEVSDVQPADEVLVGKMITTANIVARELQLSETGYRLIFNCGRDAGQDVFHIHLHVLGGRRLGWPPG